MDGLTLQIFNWLTELDENEHAEFISNCIIESSYQDTLFEIAGEDERDVYDITIYVPLKTYKKLSDFSVTTTKIEETIREFAESDSTLIRQIDWKARLRSESQLESDKRGETISNFFTKEYVSKQVRLMNQSISNNPHLALGTAKELIETCCKSILKDKRIVYESDWDVQRLVKVTNQNINVISPKISNNEITKSAVAKILGGFSNIVHGVTELRNEYGTGHGHEPNFEMLDNLYVKLAVTSASELAIFYLTIHDNDKKEQHPT